MKFNLTPKRKRVLRILLIVVALLVVLRLILPYVVLRYVNKSLASMDGYYGRVQDIDISLYRGAYKVKDIYLNKVDKGNKQAPFFSSQVIDLSVEWKALFRGSLVGEVIFVSPKLIFTQNKVEPAQLQKDTTDFKRVIKDFMPLNINRVEVQSGEITYKDPSASPDVNVSMKQVNALAQNLRNTYDSKELLPASLVADANVYGGKFNLKMKMNPLAEKPTFDLNARLEHSSLPLFNDFIKAYGGFDVNEGDFSLYAEMAAKNGKYKGYVKPVIKSLDVVGPEDKKDGLFRKLWENVVGAAGHAFKNHEKDQLATRIPLEGSTNDLSTDPWYTVFQVLRNAFVEALTSSIENEINIGSVGKDSGEEKKGLLKRIFSSDDDGKKDDDKKEKK
jgi:hypothetical protein